MVWISASIDIHSAHKKEVSMIAQNNSSVLSLFRFRLSSCLWWLVFVISLLAPAISVAQSDVRNELPRTGSSDSYGTPGSSYSLTTADPVSAANGAYSFDLPLFNLGGPMGLHFGLVYNQAINNLKTNPFGRDFSSGYFWWMPFTAGVGGGARDTAFFPYLEDGLNVAFSKPNTASTTWTLYDSTASYPDIASPVRYQLKETPTFLYLLDPIRDRVYIFDRISCQWDTPSGKALRYVLDRNDNRLTYYPTDTSGGVYYNCQVTKIEDGLGRELNFTYTNIPAPGGKPRLTGVNDGKGRSITLTYDEIAADQNNLKTLRSIADPMNQLYSFQYQYLTGPVDNPVPFSGLVASITYPKGNKPVTNTYGYHEVTNGGNSFYNFRIDQQTDALGNITTFGYAADSYTTTVTHPDAAKRDFQHYSAFSPPQGLKDEASQSAAYNKNALNQTTQVTDRLGDATSFTYQAQTGKLFEVSNAKNQKVTNSYTPQDQTFTNPANSETVTFTFYNLTRIDYPDSTNEQFTYDAKGNLLTRTDAAGKIWTYTYNAMGQVLTAANPAGGIITNTYNADGALASSKDSVTNATTYGCDTHKRLTTITAPGNRTTTIVYDANDRVTSITDENSHTYTYIYDGNGNIIQVTDPDGKTTQYAYDLMDRVTGVTNRLNQQSALRYNSRGQLDLATDPTNVAVGFGYDSRGWQNSRSLGGQTWRAGYDAEGVASCQTLPGGQTSGQTTDQLGLTATVTDPLNKTSMLARNSLNQVTGVTDPLNRTTQSSYDPRGLLTGVTLPVVGPAAFAYNDLGLPTRITDLNSQNWPFTYSTMGQLQSAADPLTQTTGYAYDASGRLQTVTYADSSTQTLTYNSANNLTGRVFSAGPTLNFTYDVLDRLTAANDLTLTYNAEGLILTTGDGVATFTATYDNAGRLKTIAYGGGLTVTYTYDDSGLLTQVSDNLTNQVSMTYNANRWLTQLTRSNGVNTTFTLDAAGQSTRIQDGTLLDQQYTMNAAGEVTQTAITGTAALDPSTALAGGQTDLTFDAASQVSSSGYVHDPRGRLAAAPGRTYSWDDASRLTGANGVAYAYNGFNELLSRTENSATTRYHYHYGIDHAPILAESVGGVMQRYYVWSPGGTLLYTIDPTQSNAVAFYHFDRIGSTLALSNDSGAATDQYAYDPYGRLMTHTGINTQPFTFVGQGGIRQEGASGALYQMRARYYDANTGRFLSRDPAWPNGQALALNPYAYANINPLSYADLSGTAPEKILRVYGNEDGYNKVTLQWNYGEVIDNFAKQGITSENLAAMTYGGVITNSGAIGKIPTRFTTSNPNKEFDLNAFQRHTRELDRKSGIIDILPDTLSSGRETIRKIRKIAVKGVIHKGRNGELLKFIPGAILGVKTHRENRWLDKNYGYTEYKVFTPVPDPQTGTQDFNILVADDDAQSVVEGIGYIFEVAR
jgi:RHS repeat-associated protein